MKRTLLSIVCLTLMSFYSYSQTWIQEGSGFTIYRKRYYEYLYS